MLGGSNGSQVPAGSQDPAGSQAHICSQVPQKVGDARELTLTSVQPVQQLAANPMTNERHHVTKTDGNVELTTALTSPAVAGAQVLSTPAHAPRPGVFFLLLRARSLCVRCAETEYKRICFQALLTASMPAGPDDVPNLNASHAGEPQPKRDANRIMASNFCHCMIFSHHCHRAWQDMPCLWGLLA